MAGGEVLQAGEGNPPQQRQTTDHSALLGVGVAMLLGLRARDLTGEGQNLETTMLVSAAYLFSDDFLRYEGKPDRPVPDKGQYGLGALYRLYQAKEGWVFLAVLSDGEWSAFCNAVGQPAWRDDPRFGTKEARQANGKAIVALLEPLFQERDAQEWEALLQAKDVACAVASGRWPDFLFDDWDGESAQRTTAFSYPGVGGVIQSGMNVHLLSTPGKVGVLEPLGTHCRPILEDLGYSAGEIDDLKANNVVNWVEG
jgi:crotonobetainyl-CoA:carnitine CoA-transferase CaiB-like acyl-CoA transferase